MKFEVQNGTRVGTVEWRSPGDVALEMDDPKEREWFRQYFAREDSFLTGSVGEPEMSEPVRGDASEKAFAHATFRLAAHHYTVRQVEEADDRRRSFAS